MNVVACREPSMSRIWHLVISLGLTTLVGYLVYRGVPDWSQALQVMLHANPLWIAAGLIFIALHMFLRAERWGVLLQPAKTGISRKNLISLTLVKYVVNVIPPRVGEVAASLVLARKEKIPAASVIAASFLERVLDMMAVIVLFGFYIVFFAPHYLPDSPRGEEIILTVRRHSVVVFALVSLGIALLLLLLRSSRWHGWIPAPVRRMVVHFTDGFRALHSGSAAARAVVLSVAIWLAITAQLWCFVLAYIDAFPFAGALLIMALTVIGVAIPTPGGVGGFQFFMNLALVNFFARYLSARDPQSQAAGISNGCYVMSMVPVFAVGVWFLYREGLTFSSLTHLSRDAESASDQQVSGN